MSESMNFDTLHEEYNKTQKYVCQNPGCGNIFGIRSRPDRDSSKFCSSGCASRYLSYQAKEKQKEYNKNPNKCKYCNTDILWDGVKPKAFKDFLKKIVCSKSCSAKHTNSGRKHSLETKNKLSKKAKENKTGFHNLNYKRIKKERYELCCLNEKCNKKFLTLNNNKKYCSTECWKQCSGGYRQGAGHSKSGYYKNIWCDSTYELAYVIYCLDNNIKIERNK